MKRPGEIVRAHRLAVEVIGLLAILALGAGLGVALWGPGDTATVSATSVPATSPPTSTTQPKRHGVRGRVSAENGDTWTVTTVKGRAVTVTLTPSTRFGTAAAPATEAQFTVGSPVTVIGTRSGDTLTATRVFTPVHPLPGTSPSTTSPSTTSPSTTTPSSSVPFSAASTREPSPVTGAIPTVRDAQIRQGQEGEEQAPTTLLLDRM